MNQKNKSILRIVLTGGGTAGHITPLLAVAKEILAQTEGRVELHFIGQKRDKNAELITVSGLPINAHFIEAGKYRRYHNESLPKRLLDVKTNALNVRDVSRVVRGYFGARRILKRINADILFAKGGFVVVPVGRAAASLGIPYITHDSDTIPGLANRLIAKDARLNAVAHKEVRAYPPEKTIVSGIPLAKEYGDRSLADQAAYKKKLGLPEKSRLLFVYAGTQGARKIDEAMDQFAAALLDTYKDLHIVHVFGRLNEQSMGSKYSSVDSAHQSRVHKMPFVDNAYDYIAAADIIVGRAGATSTAEFAAIGRACIIIPADQLTGGHQVKNAEVFAEAGAVLMVRESSLPDGLQTKIIELLDSPQTRKRLGEAFHKFSTPNAAALLAKLILDEVGER